MPLTKIDTGAIKDDAINSAKIADGTVVASDVLDNTITGAKLASDIAISTSGNITTTGALTSTGIDDNATATAITIDSSQRVGIGTSNPAVILQTNVASGNNEFRQTVNGIARGQLVATDTEMYLTNLGTGNTRFYVSGSERMRITNAGRVGIGTSSPDNPLHVVGDSTFEHRTNVEFKIQDATDAGGGTRLSSIWKSSGSDVEIGNIEIDLVDGTTGAEDSQILFKTIGNGTLAERMRITNAGRVGIGTSTVGEKLDVQDTANVAIRARTTNTNGIANLILTNDDEELRIRVNGGNSDALEFCDGGTARMVMTPAGNVGIGESSPDSLLHLKSTAPVIRLEDTDAGGGYHQLGNSASDGTLVIYADADGTNSSTANLRFSVSGSERMRIDSSGNVGIGTTSISPIGSGYTTVALDGASGSGVKFLDSAVEVAAIYANNNGYVLSANSTRVIDFYTNGSERMRIDTSGNLKITNGIVYGGGGGIGMDTFRLEPTNGSGTKIDNNNDVGSPTYRWDDVYATNGAINTSDENEKQSIQSLTSSEIAVAKRISKLFKTYKWNSAVEEKGDNARTHTGIIAQDVQQAFTDEGLDAGNYALFISSTWWEKEISVDALAEEVDENGNIITEAKDAYTYIDIKQEATDGYTERTRLGVRYPELLSFIQAYNDQRFTELEARITALENN